MKTEIFDVHKMKEMGERIRKVRKTKLLTQAQLAEILGISKDQMSNIENGKSACKPDYIFLIVQIFDITSDYLFFGKEFLEKNTE